MLEHQLIQSTGFENFGPVDAREGFAVRIRIPNYHGTRLSQLDGFDVTVDGEVFGFEQNRFRIRDEVYTLAEMREAIDPRWEMFEPGQILIDKPGGLAPGIHRVEVTARIRYSYFPPDVHIFPLRGDRLATICVA
ncbi:C-glycoside deglycosidase beta subunit domain-containing protein [Novosphingobium sp.]|uniref:C-glycoside deglycosidase beta subunit domain-containing protein n=1 Tax=Novosphingobium sp. TaxID=1874826 RepID=UPI003D12717F